MREALVIGGTRYIGRHAVEDLLAHDYRVTLFNRGNHPNPFADDDRVAHHAGDRTDDRALLEAARAVDPDVVLDVVAFHPREVQRATETFADVDAYVYVSSGRAYARDDVPKRVDVTPLRPCTADQATDDSIETYGNRKAECDRSVFRAAERGVNAMVLRPTVVYGPYDYTGVFGYWIDRVNAHDRVLVPGDGTNVWQRAYVEDVAAALRIVAEEGEAGGAYNVGDANALTLGDTVRAVADALDADVELVHANERELATGGLSYDSFTLHRDGAHVLDTRELEALGWSSTPVETAIERTVADFLDGGRPGGDTGPVDGGPDRADEETVLEILDTI